MLAGKVLPRVCAEWFIPPKADGLSDPLFKGADSAPIGSLAPSPLLTLMAAPAAPPSLLILAWSGGPARLIMLEWMLPLSAALLDA